MMGKKTRNEYHVDACQLLNGTCCTRACADVANIAINMSTVSMSTVIMSNVSM